MILLLARLTHRNIWLTCAHSCGQNHPVALLGGADQMSSARAPWFSPTASHPLAGWTVPFLVDSGLHSKRTKGDILRHLETQALELIQHHFCHFLLVRAAHKASLDSSNRETDSSFDRRSSKILWLSFSFYHSYSKKTQSGRNQGRLQGRDGA